ncbi:MAG: hypothetical protein HQL86_01110 [Magnetococcales bacterium]|nr:hypothetical protein [Magnetococcales bacterium]
MSNAHAIAFDAQESIEQLKTCGVPDKQAKGHVKLLTTVISRMDQQVEIRIDELAAKREHHTEDQLETLADRNEQEIKVRFDGLATRQELLTTKQELDYRIKELEISLKRDIKELDTRVSTLEANLRQR